MVFSDRHTDNDIIRASPSSTFEYAPGVSQPHGILKTMLQNEKPSLVFCELERALASELLLTSGHRYSIAIPVKWKRYL